MAPHLGLQRTMVPSAQVSSLTTGSITLPSARGAFYDPTAPTATGWIIKAESPADVMKRFSYTTETYTNISQVWTIGDQANADYSPYYNYKFGTGTLTSVSNSNGIIRFGYLSETASILTATTPYSFFGAGGVTNNGIAAYVVGGMDPTGASGLSSAFKMAYSTETSATLSTTLATARGAFGGVYNANTASYHGGGTPNNGTTLYTAISKMTFSTDTLSTLGATMSPALAVNPTTATTYNGTSGWYFGGYVGSGSDTSAIQRIVFSNETRDTPANLASATRATGAMSKHTTAAYFNGGTGATQNTQKIVYSTASVSTLGVGDGYTYSAGVSNQGS